MRGDFVVGADGVRSYIPQVVTGNPNPAELMGDAVCRATIHTSLTVQDPELREFVEHP